MNEAGTPTWSAAEQYDPAGAAADQDFGNLIDFDHLDLDFSIDFPEGGNHHDTNQQLAELVDSLDVQHLQNHFSPSLPQEQHDGAGGVSQHQQNALGEDGMQQTGNNFFEFNMPAFSQANPPPFSAAQDQIFRPPVGVPPTPNSVDMHGDAARYLHQMDPQTQALYEQRYQLRKGDTVAFTPLASPAVTPHETRFQIPEFTTVPGAYFSPLTSPALNAQNHHQQAQVHTSQYTTSGSSAGTSPADVDMDMLGETAIAQPESRRKLRSNKRSAPRQSNGSGRVRQSPIVRPSRQKAALLSVIPPKEVSDLVEEAQRSKSAQPSSTDLPIPRSQDGSEADSISPEPLSDMGPPPKPASVTHSPAILAKDSQTSGLSTAAGQGVCPATPASLMRLQQSPSFVTPPEALPILEDLTLPEAASSERPSLSRIDTAIYDEEQSTPRIPARKTPKLGPMSTPSASVAQSGKPSPMLSAVASPTSPGLKRIDSKLARNTKKRNSTSSTLVSPALRPKISPSIKPLLPEGAVSDDTHALLLASKSNYQNILDGTTVPGVTYPTSLSTNLTSKRTSHKIAEQGRRNRINTALQEMQALLPSPNLTAGDAKSPESGGTAAQTNSSKAAKVESAIGYIKQLQKQCSEKDKMLDQKDQEMEMLRKELAALRRMSSIGSNPKETDTPMKTESNSSPEMENAT
ncbi:hypothetical protein K469DRAFT_731112 [Zopfia rhizophila CBS 207.26]|uniref:BHLH domain-containing protein n=1 Tax=Zopfia rhizophila CBS 207.26 TaxID=1314779 RepID=A0A6A6EKD9_9PEZI|nr:hypothetical protein K469DRAFT_731112 [Zopfia rhizophila CBS 207.26]